MTTKPITYKWALMYSVFALIAVIVIEDVKNNIITTAAHFLVCIVHYGLLLIRRDLLPYGTAWQPLWVIDWGPFGKNLSLPDHLNGQYIAVRSSDVHETVKEVKAKLNAAKNRLYCDPPDGCPKLPVYSAYFRKGEFCNETGEQYRARVILAMETARTPWHVMFDTGKWEGQPENIGIAETWYLENYLGANQNGSIL